MRLVAVVLIAACGSKPAAPKPQPLDAKGLAKLLDEDLAMLGEIAHRQKGRCQPTIDELGAHVTRMKAHEQQVKTMLEDAQQAADLKKELAAYAGRVAGKSDAIAQDLGATYIACGKLCTGTCGPPPTPQPRPATEREGDQPPPPATPIEGDAGCTAKVCKERYQLERVIAEMPTY